MFGGGTLKNAIPTLKFPKSTLFRLFRVAPSVPSNTHKNYDSPYNMIALVINDLIVLAKPGGTVEFLNVEFNVGTMYIQYTMYIRCTGWPKSNVPKVRAYCSASDHLIRKIFQGCVRIFTGSRNI